MLLLGNDNESDDTFFGNYNGFEDILLEIIMDVIIENNNEGDDIFFRMTMHMMTYFLE